MYHVCSSSKLQVAAPKTKISKFAAAISSTNVLELVWIDFILGGYLPPNQISLTYKGNISQMVELFQKRPFVHNSVCS